MKTDQESSIATKSELNALVRTKLNLVCNAGQIDMEEVVRTKLCTFLSILLLETPGALDAGCKALLQPLTGVPVIDRLQSGLYAWFYRIHEHRYELFSFRFGKLPVVPSVSQHPFWDEHKRQQSTPWYGAAEKVEGIVNHFLLQGDHAKAKKFECVGYDFSAVQSNPDAEVLVDPARTERFTWRTRMFEQDAEVVLVEGPIIYRTLNGR